MHALTFDSLSTVERFVVCNLRLALHPHLPSAEREIRDGFRAARICAALPAFAGMTEILSLLWHEARVVPDVHCLHCRQVGTDEWRLLQTLAALQKEDTELASEYLRGCVPEAGVRFVLNLAMDVAMTLRAVRLPLRSIALDEAVVRRAPRTAHAAVLH